MQAVKFTQAVAANTTTTTSYTVPAGKNFVISFVAADTSPTNFVSIGSSGILSVVYYNVGGALHGKGMIFTPGETVQVRSSAISTITVCGELVDAT